MTNQYTPGDCYLGSLRCASLIASGTAISCLTLYAGRGAIASVIGGLTLLYPFLIISGDPVLNFQISTVDLFLMISMAAQVTDNGITYGWISAELSCVCFRGQILTGYIVGPYTAETYESQTVVKRFELPEKEVLPI